MWLTDPPGRPYKKPMDDDVRRWNRVKQVFQDALERRADERGLFVRDACGDDRELQSEVESLLAAHAAAGGFAEGPAIEELAPSAAVALRDGAWAETDLQPLHPGVRLGKYRIERQLGHGGMGVVFLAHDATLDRGVAIKVLGRRDDDEASHARLLREARNASALNHPNICTVYEVGERSGLAFIAMEYVDGRSLRDLVADGPLPVEDAVRYAIEAADALAHAHDRGVVHRDLKAANTII
jgi:hypothetical protein